MDATLCTSVEVNRTQPRESGIVAERGSMLRDHCRRIFAARKGFRVYGLRWFLPWLTYCLSPVINRIARGRMISFKEFNVRLGDGDLYTFANIFADYPVREIERGLSDVDLVVDLGANVGAFSCLIVALCRRKKLDLPIIAVEPNAANVKLLRQQPFAKAILIHDAAVGPANGTGRLVRGQNSVTDCVDFSGTHEGTEVKTISLESLCDRPALVKMDIEGGELAILRHGLPENVRHLVLEWHHPGSPADFVRGNWKRISTDIHGATTWHFRR